MANFPVQTINVMAGNGIIKVPEGKQCVGGYCVGFWRLKEARVDSAFVISEVKKWPEKAQHKLALSEKHANMSIDSLAAGSTFIEGATDVRRNEELMCKSTAGNICLFSSFLEGGRVIRRYGILGRTMYSMSQYFGDTPGGHAAAQRVHVSLVLSKMRTSNARRKEGAGGSPMQGSPQE